MESKTVLDSGLHAVGSGFQLLDSGLCQWNLDFGFQSLVGFWISWTLFSGSKSQSSGFHKQKFPEYRNSDSLIWGDSYAYVTPSWTVHKRLMLFIISILALCLLLCLWLCLSACVAREDRLLLQYKWWQKSWYCWNTLKTLQAYIQSSRKYIRLKHAQLIHLFWYTKILAIQCNHPNNWTTFT